MGLLTNFGQNKFEKTQNMKIYEKEPEPQKRLDEFADFPAEEPFNWRMYNNSQTREKIIVLTLLKELCNLLEGDAYIGKGRRSMPAGHMIFCMGLKVYSSLSSRRLISELELCRNKFFIHAIRHSRLTPSQASQMFSFLITRRK